MTPGIISVILSVISLREDDCTAEWDEVLKAVNLFQREAGRHMEIVGSGDLGVAVLG